MLDAWRPLCDKYGCAAADLAIAWILHQDPGVAVLSGSTSPDQLRQNVRALAIDLSEQDALWMREYAERIG